LLRRLLGTNLSEYIAINNNFGVSIIVCCYNSVDRLPATLDHLKSQVVPEHIPWEVIVVDNGSTDQTAEVARTLWGDLPGVPFRVVSQPTPGLIYARIKGFETAKYEFVSFVDDDNWVAPNWVQMVYEKMIEFPQAGQVGGRSEAVYESDPPIWFKKIPWSFGIGEQAEFEGELGKGAVLWGTGAHRKSAWLNLQAKGFSPLLTGRKGSQQLSGEDLEIGYSLLITGWKLYYTPDLVFKHYMPSSRFNKRKYLQMRRGYGRSSVYLNMYRLLFSDKVLRVTVNRRVWNKKIADLIRNFITHPKVLVDALTWKDTLDPEVLMMHKHIGSFCERMRLLAKVDAIEKNLQNIFYE